MKTKFLLFVLLLFCLPVFPIYAGQTELPPPFQFEGYRIRYNVPYCEIPHSAPCWVGCVSYSHSMVKLTGLELASYTSDFKALLYINGEKVHLRKLVWQNLDENGVYWLSVIYHYQFDAYNFEPGTYTFRFEYYGPFGNAKYNNIVVFT